MRSRAMPTLLIPGDSGRGLLTWSEYSKRGQSEIRPIVKLLLHHQQRR